MGSVDFWGAAFAAPHTQEKGIRRGHSGPATRLEDRPSYELEYRDRRKKPFAFSADNNQDAIKLVAVKMMLLTPLRATAFAQAGGNRIVRLESGRRRQIFPHEPRPPH